MPAEDFNEQTEIVKKALQNPQYEWRTIEGISLETGLRADEVLAVLDSLPEVVRSRRVNQDGEPIYSTRERFRETASITDKIFGSLTNRAD